MRIKRGLSLAVATVALTPLDVIAAEDKVVARASFSALHVGPFRLVRKELPR